MPTNHIYNGFRIGDRVTISPEGHCILYVNPSYFTKVWTVIALHTGNNECLLRCENVEQYMNTTYMNKIKEENTMNIKATRKSVASLEQRNDESIITCEYCGCIIDADDAIEFEGSHYCADHIDEVSFVCDHCGMRRPIDERNYANGDNVCDECLDENYSYCDQCGRYVPNEDANWCSETDEYVCDYCLDNERGYFRCANCGDIHQIENSTNVYCSDDSDQLWCSDCVDNWANYCEECDRYFDCRDVSVTNGVCQYCSPLEQNTGNINYWEAPHGVRSYSYKPDPCFCMTDKQKLIYNYDELVHFGFELEMEDHRNSGYNADEDADFMNNELGFTYCKHDGSLDDGIELVSHPATLEYLMERKDVFAKTFNEMIRRGYTSHNNGNCGLHVHLSLKPFIASNEYASDALVRIVDNLWDKLVRFSRRTKRQLNRWADRYDTKGDVFEEITKNIKRNCGRYMAVNMENTHTIEIRMFRGTLKVDTFFAVLQMVRRLVDEAMECFCQEDADAVTWEKLIDCEYTELKEFCEMRFAEHHDPLDDEEHTPDDRDEQISHRSETLYSMSEEEMHRANIRNGDTVIVCDLEQGEDIEGGVVADVIGDQPVNGTICTVLAADAPYAICLNASDNSNVFRIMPNFLRRVNTNFRNGDYVRFVIAPEQRNSHVYYSPNLRTGDTGIVCVDSLTNIGVEFNRDFGGHSLDGRVTPGHGQWINRNELVLI